MMLPRNDIGIDCLTLLHLFLLMAVFSGRVRASRQAQSKPDLMHGIFSRRDAVQCVPMSDSEASPKHGATDAHTDAMQHTSLATYHGSQRSYCCLDGS